MSDDAKFCTQCGSGIDDEQPNAIPSFIPPVYRKTQKRYNSMCVAGFVTALCGLMILPPIAGILALVFSCVGLKKRALSNQMGKNLAIAGILIGVFDLIFGAFLVYAYLYYLRYYGIIVF